ncbi:MAG: hypothetical protein FJ190_11460 [Gammaproteobacteria bacterium]|nr:hypothetical protein [Gammaproteobacteria bacterium]
MGGRGSGKRWHFSANETTDSYRFLDVRRWQRDGLLKPGLAFNWSWSRNGKVTASIHVMIEHNRIMLKYRHHHGNEPWRDANYPVYLDWTPCTYGGARAWFLCPAAGCGRRVAILYGGAVFACRHCYQLTYPSQRERPDDRAARRADKIREQLAWEPGILNGAGIKPKGMHRRTYEHLRREHDAMVDKALLGMAKRFGILDAKSGGF